eukprot:2432389-Amphidinium_carterae.1
MARSDGQSPLKDCFVVSKWPTVRASKTDDARVLFPLDTVCFAELWLRLFTLGCFCQYSQASGMKILWSMQLLGLMMTLVTAIQSPVQAGVDPYDVSPATLRGKGLVIHVHVEEPSRLSPLGQQREREAKVHDMMHALELAESEQQSEHTMDAVLAAQQVGHVWEEE